MKQKQTSYKKRDKSVKPRGKGPLSVGQGVFKSIGNELKSLEGPSSKHKSQQTIKQKPPAKPITSTIPTKSKTSASNKRDSSVAPLNHSRSSSKGAPYTNPFQKPKTQNPQHASQPNNKNGNLLQTNPHTEDGREKIAKDTMKIIHDQKYVVYDPNTKTSKTKDISRDIKASKENTVTFSSKDYENKSLNAHKHSKICQINVLNVSSFGAAKHLVTIDNIKNTCVLNFASATKPGGGFLNGRQAQEESLSRQSALYESIKDSNFYSIHSRRPNDNYYTDSMIYSPNVPVFRDDRNESLLPVDEYFTVNVITSAAPNKSKIDKEKYSMNSKPDLNKILLTRIRKIIICAIDKENDALVLGAYGCGVFGNDPKDVSKIFKKVLVDEDYGKYFRKVVFAIPGPHSENFKAFSAEFS